MGTLFPAVRFRPGVSFPDEDRCVQRCFKAGLTMTGVRQRKKISVCRISLTFFYLLSRQSGVLSLINYDLRLFKYISHGLLFVSVGHSLDFISDIFFQSFWN